MSIVDRADTVLATPTGQTFSWVLILAIVLGFFTQAESEVTFLATVLALGLSWILGASYGRHHDDDDTDEDDESG